MLEVCVASGGGSRIDVESKAQSRSSCDRSASSCTKPSSWRRCIHDMRMVSLVTNDVLGMETSALMT